MFALHKLGIAENKLQLNEEYDRAKQRLDIIDFYTDDKNYKYCLSGMWCIVAVFDKTERDKLLIALDEGKKLLKTKFLLNFLNLSIPNLREIFVKIYIMINSLAS